MSRPNIFFCVCKYSTISVYMLTHVPFLFIVVLFTYNHYTTVYYAVYCILFIVYCISCMLLTLCFCPVHVPGNPYLLFAFSYFFLLCSINLPLVRLLSFFYLLLFYINCIQKPSINTYILSLSAHILPTCLYIRENCLNIIFLFVCLSHRWGGIFFPFPDINPVCLCVSRRRNHLHRGSTVYRTTSDVRHCHLSLANVIALRRH